MDVQSTEVIVIGGGISGLCAAKLLFEQGIDKLLVLEARDRVGGRTHTIENPSVKYTDLGGSYVGPTQNRIQRVARDLGVKTYRVYLKGKSSEYFNGRRKQYGDGLSTWNPIAILDYYNLIRTVDRMCDSIELDRPWQAPNALEWDRMTCEEFFNKMCWTTYCKKRMVQIYQDGFATEPWECSLLYFLWYLKCCDGILRSVSTDNGGQERKFIGGSQQISNKIKDKLGERVILSSPVIRLKQNGDHVVVSCENGKNYKAKYVISAMPQALLNHISFEPPLPALKNQLIQRMPMGSVIKTLTFYDKAFWREKGLNGLAIADSESGPVQSVIDDTKPDGSHPALMGFISGDQARHWCNKTQEEREKAVSEQYSKVYGCKEALNPFHYVDKNWLGEQYSGGCYVSVIPPGVLTKYGKALRCPVGRLYFAGTETATFWSGYMDGAVQAGERAAREVLHQMGRIPEDEIHQDEPPPPDEAITPCQLTFLQRCLPTVPGFLMGMALIAGSVGFLSFKHFSK